MTRRPASSAIAPSGASRVQPAARHRQRRRACRGASAKELPPRPARRPRSPTPRSASRAIAGIDADVRSGLLDDRPSADPAFDPDHVPAAARRQAYEIIVTAFAEGNRKILEGPAEPRRLRRLRRAPSPSARTAASRSTRASSASIKADIVEAEVKSGVRQHHRDASSASSSRQRATRPARCLSGDPQAHQGSDRHLDLQRATCRRPRRWPTRIGGSIATQSPA